MYAFINKDVSRWLPCYTLNYHLNNDKDPLSMDAKHQFVLNWSYKNLVLNFDAMNNVYPSIQPGGILGLGSPFEPIIPKIRLRHDRDYIIKLQLEEERRLPFPYDTDCHNYTEAWLKNNRTGPRSKEMCVELCIQEISKESYCGPCLSSEIYVDGAFPLEERCNETCDAYYHYSYDEERKFYEDKKYCSGICKEDCLMILSKVLEKRLLVLTSDSEIHRLKLPHSDQDMSQLNSSVSLVVTWAFG
ncbi:uncharacterized protein LOC118200502 isoform X2 [Stegodyphus dumicola]|uniref:uncharacterized protein LOC118200502 isoform X2 n=1 Tax=Stegodyphus dumicola TaxID=202533 RepID=UPI0015AC29E1|nr:uncharacterized protein LOC118200502 isoform X2 [Stegodyphus dumicola]